jgi:NAD(P)-dependent dehydrogenase (short-subunit alcohol dehydrogenase family)
VVSLTSVGHWASDVVWDDPHFASTPYDRWVAYGQSKTANCLFVAALDRRYGSVGLDAFAVNPGVAMTRLARHLTPADFESMGEGPGGPPKVMSVAAAAATSVWAATAADLAGLGGRYLADCQVADDHAPWAFDPAGAERLWDMSEGMLSPV